MFLARPILLSLALACICPSAYSQSGPPAYVEREVRYLSQTSGVVLGGTFSRPDLGGPFPVVLLIPGSGRQDRDETVGEHKPFKVLAAYLARHGIASLRVDRRGIGLSTGDFGKATTEDFASDAEAGVSYLLTRPDIDPKHVGLLGHGEGALIAAITAAKMSQVSFVVLLAAPAVPGEQVLLTQRERAERAAQIPAAQVTADLRVSTLLFSLAREGKSKHDLERALERERNIPDEVLNRWSTQLPSLESPWLRFFLAYNPIPTYEKIKCPVLALEGAKDMDVSPDQNVPALKAAFARSGNTQATVEVLPGLNYYFQEADTGLPIEYPTLPESISALAEQKIGDWIAQQTS